MSTKRYINVEKQLQNLKDSELEPANVDAIRKFIDHCAAEDISEVRQSRLITALKSLILNFGPDSFELSGATEEELKMTIASLNRSDYADSTKHTMRAAAKKFYKIENGGHEHPEKVDFFSASASQKSTVSREDIFTKEELKRLFSGFINTRDRAFTMVLYESAARPGELLSRNLGDFTSNAKGDFIYLEGIKGTPDRTNQLVRSGRPLREWIAQHPLGGEVGDIDDPSVPLWVKTQQQECKKCGKVPQQHGNTDCLYDPDLRDRWKYDSFLRRFQDACERASIPDNKRRPYNLRHTRLTEVATFMGYEQLNKFAGWTPGSDRAKVYVHLNNDDVNEAIREEYGLSGEEDEDQSEDCPFCGTENESIHSECRNCGRPLSLEKEQSKEEKQEVLERLTELEEKGVLEKLEQLEN
ncbi:tyrosine-type recombinase/integrase [Haloplanus aerogenes]|uniref:Integrase n=1 Tax=Haloplanus aerogenes TaxID=660522 RepID=A0A3M0CU39_9EURY|nr:tyrosine-type recombinase/integrase [Haloplanus aerogenes]AZH26693.1 integrase [Haloplanus aerogenes]RMB12932.1 phage integrase family protein [Haloplanus aerogenes]